MSWSDLFIPAKHTHTHPFNGPFSGTIQVSRYQKGNTNLDFTEARHSEWQWHQLGHMHPCQNCKKGKGSPYSITERRVLELIPVPGISWW